MKQAVTRKAKSAEQPARPETSRRAWATPPVDIRDAGEAIVLVADMPGVGKEGVKVTLDGTQLTIEGERTVPMPEGQPLHQESSRLAYRRVFEIAPDIDAGRISARVADGVLTVTLPKAEAVKPRRIEVTD